MQFSANAAAADGIGAYQLLPISSDASRPAGAEEVEKLEQYVKTRRHHSHRHPCLEDSDD